ncbi:MAG: YebC/PmpR family DNA-binding transcriptional regulator [Bacteroidales bacterium]|nr:YebC/PmpR family DNA-binding transcriptional regulator [Bacteroidales bacterium]
MSGHSKWSTIKHKKGAKDAKRAKIFTRLIKELTVAVKEGGGPDPEFNPRLRLAISNAKGANMPKDNIERAIKKADSEGSNLQEYTFEGTGQGGAAIFVECLSDNNQRTVSDVRHVFSKYGGELGKNGSLSYIFERKGIFVIPDTGFDPEELELELIDAGLEEMEKNEEEKYVLTVDMKDFGNMQKKLEELKIEAENAELQRIPKMYKRLDPETALKALNIVEKLEELDDVQNVYHDIELTDEVAEAIEEQE